MEYDFSVLKQQLFDGVLGSLERERKQFTGRLRRVFFFSVAFSLLFFALAVLFTIQHYPMVWQLYLLSVMALLTGWGIWLYRHLKFKDGFRAAFKEQVIPFIAKKYDERLEYYPYDDLMKEYMASGIFTREYDRYKAEDTFRGTFDLTTFSFGEIFTEYKTVTTDSKGNRQEHWHTIFRGLLFASDFHKHFSGETFVDTDTMERMFGKLGRRFQKWNTSRKGDLIKMENPEFEKQFAVYSTNEQEARYILTPSMMERMNTLREKMNAPIAFSFRNNHLYIAVSKQGDFFEPTIYRTLLREEIYRSWWELLVAMSRIVEDMNLNTRIWTRE